ncbi:hypothetical protein [Spirillospora sp. NPDC048819]|uniref:hypothetical protein n=1 Tax=Spirillospora sp. NPDC048819 TaxID=3155268 RepID=UPI0033E512FD
MRRRTFAALALVPALALGLQGCGGDGGGSGGSTAKAASDQEKMRKFAQCMRDNGIDMPDPSGDGRVTVRKSRGPSQGGGGPGEDDEMMAAQKKCRHLMPNGGKPPELKPEEVAKLRAFSKCMRDNGISEYPDPDADGRMLLKAGPGTGIDPESQKFQAAQKACDKHMPGDKGPRFSSKVGD